MATEKIKLDKDLVDKARRLAAETGYSSAEELITHLLEKEIGKTEGADSEDEIKKKLKGLGYIG